MTKKPKLVYGIKGKLVSAACMLLVAVIMVVSSTYAWFTLSTAPEVTGIQTAVGANGSLEMALLPSSGLTNNITSSVGDSVKDETIKNLTWGNIVDLNDPSYGLDKITLYPSELNVDDTGLLGASFLKTPTYGSDGRVSDVVANTSTGAYNGTTFPVADGFGVRAVGVASGMTPRQLAYRNAAANANNLAVKAKNAAAASLNTYGGELANVVVARALNNADSFTAAQVNALKGIVADLAVALGYIEQAYKQVILGYAASADTADDAVWVAVQAAIEGGKTLAAIVTEAGGAGSFSTAIDALNASVTNVATADGILEALEAKDDYKWTEISEVVTLLADASKMTVNDIPANEVKSEENMSKLVNSVASTGINVAMVSGAGVYADIADHCGDYNASIVIAEMSASGLTLTNVNAKMKTNSTLTPNNYLTVAASALKTAGAPESTGVATNPISEFYGYIIDLAFRTNAAESKLLLQTMPVDRIYSDNKDETAATMGHGSSMTFSSSDPNFGTADMLNLMSHIRVVFFAPAADGSDTNKVLAYAKLNVSADKVVTSADGITAYLYLVNEADELITDQAAASIMELQQNAAAAVSALVYLDGTDIQNDDVSAVAKSLEGKLNLQFSSSATLVPMDYSFENVTE